MGDFFCDTSAVVKRYVKETGTEYVDGLVDPKNGNVILLADITRVEVVAAITRKVKGGATTLTEAESALAAFKYDLANIYYMIEISPAILDAAMIVARKHGLRGYDSVQLAAALSANADMNSFGLSTIVVVSADGELNAAATAEGLAVENPNDHL